MGERLKTDFIGYLADAKTAIAQQNLGPVDTDVAQITDKRSPSSLFKRPAKVEPTHIERARDVAKFDTVGEVPLNIVFGSPDYWRVFDVLLYPELVGNMLKVVSQGFQETYHRSVRIG